MVIELAGVYELLFYVVGLFVLPVSRLSYLLKVFSKLYLVNFDKEADKAADVLREEKMHQRKNGKLKHQVIQDKIFFTKELKYIHPFLLKRSEVLRLFILTHFKYVCYCCCARNKKAKKLQ